MWKREKKPEKGPGGDLVAGLKAKEKGFEIDTFASYIDGPLAVRLVYTFWGCLRFMLCSRRYDLFHLHTAERGSTFRKYFYLWWAKRTGRKVIVHIHGAEYLTFYDGLGSLGRRVVDRFLQRADLVLALSESWKRELEARFCIDTCRTLYNGGRYGKVPGGGDGCLHLPAFFPDAGETGQPKRGLRPDRCGGDRLPEESGTDRLHRRRRRSGQGAGAGGRKRAGSAYQCARLDRRDAEA